jgi:hypothetical protein
VIGKSLQGRLSGAPVRTLMIDGRDPLVELLVESFEGVCLNGCKKLGSNGLKEALHFAASLGLVGFGVDEGNSKGCRDLMEEPGAEGGSIVHVELAGKSTLEKSVSECAQVGVEVLV